MTLHDRKPPYNEDAEQAVLSVCLGSHGKALTAAADVVRDSDFYLERHRRLFRAMLAVSAAGQVVDPITVAAWLDRARELEGAGGKEYIGFLIDVAPTDENVAHHAGLVADAARARRLIEIAMEAETLLWDRTPWETVEGELTRRLVNFRADLTVDRAFDDKAAMAAAAIAYLDSELVGGSPYGFSTWDAATLPPLPGHLVLIGGASGSGKSTVARNVIRQWAQRFGHKVGWLTCEMTGEEQLVHLALMDLGLGIEDYYRKRLTQDQRNAFADAIHYWRDVEALGVNEMGNVTPDRALRIFARWRDQGYTHFVLDHLHRLDYGATKSGDDLRIPVAAFAKQLKSFAKDRACTVVALVQYTKMKPHEEPDDSRIREANNILEEADSVFHIYRPLVAHEQTTQGTLHPLTKSNGLRYFEGEAPTGSRLAHDAEYVYVKLGKQRRRIRDGLVRVPFNAKTGALYDSQRTP